MSHRIHIVPTWSFRDDLGRTLDPQLFTLLRHIEQQGKLTSAARETGISYRHAWNQLNKWADFFGTPLVIMAKGKGASLTALGDKLLWAEKRVVARLEPQLENITSELNLELARLLEGQRPSLRLNASHGYAVELLPRFTDGLELDLQYMSGEDAITALARDQCDVAGFHLPVDLVSTHMHQHLEQWLKPRAHRIIRFIRRRQGLMVKADNPMKIHSLSDLTRPEVRFIQRQRESGTRQLLEALLQQQAIDSAAFNSVTNVEFTHSAIAAHIAAGMADAGFGVEAAARQFGLDFIPLAQEHYLLACHQRSLETPALQSLLARVSSDEFRDAVNGLPGYSSEGSGELVTLDELAGAGS